MSAPACPAGADLAGRRQASRELRLWRRRRPVPVRHRAHRALGGSPAGELAGRPGADCCGPPAGLLGSWPVRQLAGRPGRLVPPRRSWPGRTERLCPGACRLGVRSSRRCCRCCRNPRCRPSRPSLPAVCGRCRGRGRGPRAAGGSRLWATLCLAPSFDLGHRRLGRSQRRKCPPSRCRRGAALPAPPGLGGSPLSEGEARRHGAQRQPILPLWRRGPRLGRRCPPDR